MSKLNLVCKEWCCCTSRIWPYNMTVPVQLFVVFSRVRGSKDIKMKWRSLNIGIVFIREFFSLQTLQWYHDKISTSQGGQTMASVTCVHEEQCSGKKRGIPNGDLPTRTLTRIGGWICNMQDIYKDQQGLNHDTRTLFFFLDIATTRGQFHTISVHLMPT